MSAQAPEPCALLLRESSRGAPEALRTQEVTMPAFPNLDGSSWELVKVERA